jgi:hypothetical protein
MLALLLLAGPAFARDTLGVYENWGAFRDAQPFRCYAITQPAEPTGGKWRPFATVSTWPGARVRGQVHIRLSYSTQPGSSATLRIDARQWPLVVGGADAWAINPQHDAGIVAAMRSGTTLSVSATGSKGGRFFDSYALKGVASAMDAAALGCVRGR